MLRFLLTPALIFTGIIAAVIFALIAADSLRLANEMGLLK